ncbi:YjbF family lipoprotein [Thalassovita sp.]|jgi:hypothetical protein|uniref:YjbF family lipoprotein n=1 Tax=Thalassovita sp. TaxID=1979401 RepID=UPI003B5A72FB
MKMLWPLLLLAACAAPKPVRVDVNQIVTRAQLDQVTSPLIAASLTGPGTFATLAPVGVNGDVVTWRSADQITLSLKQGVIVATRGLGQDLMAADVEGTLRMIAGASEPYTRIQTYLDGEYQTQFRAFTCRTEGSAPEQIEIVEQTHQTRRIEESCFSPGTRIANTFWVDAGGTIWKSRQWIGPGLGYMETDLLVK